jgi:GNAT superfamily N-acetyltransferase
VSTRPPSRIGASDYDRVAALWEASGLHIKPVGRDSREAFARQLAGDTQAAFGVEDADGRLIGVVIATHDGRKGWINRLAVHPDARRQGVAMRLIGAAEGWLHQQGMQIIAALIEPGNEASLALVEAAGYEPFPGLHYVSRREGPEV